MLKKIVFIFIAIVFVVSIISISNAGEIKITNAGYAASLSKENMNKGMQFVFDNDLVALQKMLDAGLIFILKEGVPVFVVETEIFSGLIKIRPVGQLFEVWTVVEAVKYKN